MKVMCCSQKLQNNEQLFARLRSAKLSTNFIFILTSVHTDKMSKCAGQSSHILLIVFGREMKDEWRMFIPPFTTKASYFWTSNLSVTVTPASVVSLIFSVLFLICKTCRSPASCSRLFSPSIKKER